MYPKPGTASPRGSKSRKNGILGRTIVCMVGFRVEGLGLIFECLDPRAGSCLKAAAVSASRDP